MNGKPAILLVAVFVIAVFATFSYGEECNGSADLCGKSYSDVTFAGTHNAMSNVDEKWDFPNQIHGLTRQLDDGIRWLSLDLHYFNGEVYLCHTLCVLGRESLESGLRKIKKFMDANSNEVVSIDFESYVEPKDVETVFRAAGLADMLHVQTPGQPWPTLGEMIKSGRRLVVFNGSTNGTALFNKYTGLIGATHWHYESVSQFDCGDPAGKSLYAISHFLTRPYAMILLGRKANREKVIMRRALGCWKKTGRRPNVITVDFYSIGGLIESVKKLNAIDASGADALLEEYGK
jgi:hypothetical protein